MTLKDEYYDHVLNKNPAVNPSKKILFEIVADLTDRRGFRQEWRQVDEDIQEEILETWLKIIESHMTYA